MDVALISINGGGKGTQAKKLVRRHGFKHVGTGDALRRERDLGTPLGKQVAPYLEAGTLAPDHLVFPAIHNMMAQVPRHQPIVFDGMPRTRGQMLQLEDIIEELDREIICVYIKVSREEALRRMSGRGREDDNDPATVQERLEAFENETLPVLEEYRRHGALIEVDGMMSEEEVFAAIVAALELAPATV